MSEEAAACASSTYSPVNHVFVDVENVKQIDPAVVGGRNLTLHLFLGPQNKKLDVSVVEKIIGHAQMVKITRTPKSEKNALDFVLAYHLGQAVLAEPKGYFHIVSKDKGFDVLIEHLKSRQVKARRHDDWTGLIALATNGTAPPKPAPGPQVQPKQAKPTPAGLSDQAQKLWNLLLKHPRNRPKKLKTLQAKALDFSGKEKNPATAASLVEELRKASHIAIDDKGAVSYRA